MDWLKRNLWVVLATVFSVTVVGVLIRRSGGPIRLIVVSTNGEIQAVHADVTVGGKLVRGTSRFATNETVATGPDGRGRARLDDGTVLVLDRGTKLTPLATGVQLDAGQIFVQGAPNAPTQIAAGGATALVAGSTVAIEKTADGAKFYCANGELIVRGTNGEKRVLTGETATANASGINVVPEKAFNDWTGGMATPWSASGPPRGAIGELWGKLSATSADAGSPLAVRAHEVTAVVDGEVAITEVRTTYFNAGSATAAGDFRMSLPPGAIVSRFALGDPEALVEGNVIIGAQGRGQDVNGVGKLEWAGEGWVRGTVPGIRSGGTTMVVVRYVEWLSPAGNRLTYRYPMVSETAAPVIGEFKARIDVSGAKARVVSIGQGATVTEGVISLQRADFRPTADLVVDMEISPGALGPARAYAAMPPAGDEAGDFLVVRTEVPSPESEAAGNNGVALSIVVDTSLSVDAALLDAERALVEALVEGLGSRDRVAVFAGDQATRVVGPAEPGPVTPARRAAIREGLAQLRPGGATDLGVALQKAADAIPSDAPAGMVVYVGDGWPTLGDVAMSEIRGRLARRAGGAPRLGAIAVGPLANRFGLNALVRGTGPIFEIGDRSDAAQVAVNLLAEALKPSVAGVELDLGPEVERVYPRGAHAVIAGSTVMAVGRVRGAVPSQVTLRYRKGAKVVEEQRALFRPMVTDPADIRRRWASARIEELALRNQGSNGNEAAIDVAVRYRLLTPWTGWVIGNTSGPFMASPLDGIALDLAPSSTLGAWFATPTSSFGTIVGPPPEPEDDPKEDEAAYKSAIEAAARRTLEDAMEGVRACRASRAALRPEISGNIKVVFELKGDGSASKIEVRAVSAADDDPALDRCIQVIVTNLSFFVSGLKTTIVVEHELRLPPARDPKGRTCSPTSQVPLPLRRGVWLARLRGTSDPSKEYLAAKARCELPTWTDRRVFLELVLDKVQGGVERVQLARYLEDAGDGDAAALLRREAVRRATTPMDLWQIRIALIGNERKATGAFRKEYRAAATDAQRLDTVRRFLKLAPHDASLRRLLLTLLETLGRRMRRSPRFNTIARTHSRTHRCSRWALRSYADSVMSKSHVAPSASSSSVLPATRMRVHSSVIVFVTKVSTMMQPQRIPRSPLIPDDPSATLRLGHARRCRAPRCLVAHALARVDDWRTIG
ncbi:MAG: VWA domain-containing protein [Polyangiaceae bacterium]